MHKIFLLLRGIVSCWKQHDLAGNESHTCKVCGLYQGNRCVSICQAFSLLLTTHGDESITSNTTFSKAGLSLSLSLLRASFVSSPKSKSSYFLLVSGFIVV